MGRPQAPLWQPGKITSTQESSGHWEARTRYRDESGQSRQMRRSGRTKGAAETALKRAILEEQEAFKRGAVEEVVTVEVLALDWLESRRPAPVEIDPDTQAGTTPTDGISIQTWMQYERSVREKILPRLGGMEVPGIGTKDCEAVLHGLYDKNAGTGYRTAALAKQVLQQIMDYAVRQGHRTDNPVRSVSRIPKRRHKPQVMTDATVAATHRAAQARQVEPGVGGPRPTSRLADIVLLLAGTGLRIGEALAIRWSDVDMASSPATVSVTGTLVEQTGLFFRQSFPKSDASERTIPVPDWVAGMLLRRRTNDAGSATGAVFATRVGTFVRPSNFRDDLRKALRSAGIQERITPHTFRRTVATALAAAAGDQAAADQLGHASPDVTRTHYIFKGEVVPDHTEALMGLAPH